MKVVQINAVYGIGSTGIIVKDVETMIYKNGDEPFVVYQCAEEAPIHGYRVGNRLDWKLHAVMTRVLGKQGYMSIGATYRLIDYLDRIEPDIVHLHNLHANYINLNILLKYLAQKNITTVLTLHDCWFFTGKCFHFAACGCEKWKTTCKNCPQNKEDVKSLFFDQSTKVFKDKRLSFQAIPNLTVVGCSDWIKRLAEQSPIFQGKNFTRIYNGVDTTVFCETGRADIRKKQNLKGKFVILGMANKWFQPKNESMLNAMITGLGADEVLVLIGCSDGQRALLSSREKVIHFGFIRDREELAEIYRMSDVFVNLTFEDTLPTVNMEAICCGTPVITYDSCGSPELVQEGVTGYVIPQGDVIQLRSKILMVKNKLINRAQCAAIGKSLFDKRTQYEEYLKLYHNAKDREGQ